MAKNKDLIKDIQVLSKELDIPVKVEDLNNKKLTALLSDLKSKKKDADNETQADHPKPQEPKPQEPKPQEPKPQEPKPQEPAKKKFYVCKGKSISSRKGMIHEGQEVKAKDLIRGIDDILHLVELKAVEHR